MEFNYYIDSKSSMWQRQYYKIEAETLEEADKQALAIYNADAFEEPDGVEELYDTYECMSVADNNGSATMELYRDAEEFPELLKDNTEI